MLCPAQAAIVVGCRQCKVIQLRTRELKKVEGREIYTPLHPCLVAVRSKMRFTTLNCLKQQFGRLWVVW